MSEIIIYQSPDNRATVEVKFDRETVWLNRHQLALLFNRDIKTIGKHINNVFEEGELVQNSVVAKFATTADDGKTYQVEHYNLDVIISVGYRVKSQRGTQFRQWATQRLKDYLVQGYAINQKRLAELGKIAQLIEQSGSTDGLQLGEAKGLLEILGGYTRSFVLLNQYDSHNLPAEAFNPNITYEIEYTEAKAAIAELKSQLMAKKEATELFGNEKDDSFSGILGSIVQTFGGQYLYPSIEEQAAHLLYFVIKNHPFSDGNKRIGAFLFVWFLEKNKHRFKASGELKINDNALTAIALLVAQSDPNEKELMVKLIGNLILG
ncbi:MAG: virulence protein RhuM/Fic/DOC family protein [Saprospiraceae bacterium]|nr:virulence protein RhuM/Fic/DOC family protein [Saprospiraceae bacterium]